MTLPNRYIEGQVVFLTRVTQEQRLYMRPSEATTNIVGYHFARAARATGQNIHAACAISNHMHSVQTDVNASRSRFMQRCYSQIAVKLNRLLGRDDTFWSGKEPGNAAILDLSALVEKLLYTWLQPVAAGLVERAEDWTGFKVLPRDWGKPMQFHKSEFSGRSMPAVESFVPQPPPGFEDLPLELTIEFFEDLLRRAEDLIIEERDGKFLGIEACQNADPFSTPRNRHRPGKLNPKFCSSDKTRAARAIVHMQQFRRRHRITRDRIGAGETDVQFPSGTLVRCPHVHLEPVPDDDPHLMDASWPSELYQRFFAFAYTSRAA